MPMQSGHCVLHVLDALSYRNDHGNLYGLTCDLPREHHTVLSSVDA